MTESLFLNAYICGCVSLDKLHALIVSLEKQIEVNCQGSRIRWWTLSTIMLAVSNTNSDLGLKHCFILVPYSWLYLCECVRASVLPCWNRLFPKILPMNPSRGSCVVASCCLANIWTSNRRSSRRPLWCVVRTVHGEQADKQNVSSYNFPIEPRWGKSWT